MVVIWTHFTCYNIALWKASWLAFLWYQLIIFGMLDTNSLPHSTLAVYYPHSLELSEKTNGKQILIRHQTNLCIWAGLTHVHDQSYRRVELVDYIETDTQVWYTCDSNFPLLWAMFGSRLKPVRYQIFEWIPIKQMTSTFTENPDILGRNSKDITDPILQKFWLNSFTAFAITGNEINSKCCIWIPVC